MTHQITQKFSEWASTSEIEKILDGAYEEEVMAALYIDRSRGALTGKFILHNMIAAEDKYFTASEVKNKLKLAEIVDSDYLKYMGNHGISDLQNGAVWHHQVVGTSHVDVPPPRGLFVGAWICF